LITQGFSGKKAIFEDCKKISVLGQIYAPIIYKQRKDESKDH